MLPKEDGGLEWELGKGRVGDKRDELVGIALTESESDQRGAEKNLFKREEN